jgi:predicted nucleic-acid-binding protein
VWVLDSAYDYSRAEIAAALDKLLLSDAFEVDRRDEAHIALRAYGAGRADFADYLIGAMAKACGCSRTVTLDRRLRGASGFEVL